MPELPEVEVLVRHLRPLLQNKVIGDVHVHRAKIVAPSSPARFRKALLGARFGGLTRRGKYLLFELRSAKREQRFTLVGHLGMTGRMYLVPAGRQLAKHSAVSLKLGRHDFVFEDTRYFGRLTLETNSIERLGPEPLSDSFTAEALGLGLLRSQQPIKVKLLDQSLVAGIGNIYASEALFRAGISPRTPARKLSAKQVKGLWRAIREVLTEAIECGSTVPLDYGGSGSRDGLFYFGRPAGAPDYYEERLRVYDRKGQACLVCGQTIRRFVQAARSTFYCPNCQTS